ACSSKDPVSNHRASGNSRLLQVVRNDDAFAGGKSRRLDDNRRSEVLDGGERLVERTANRRSSGGNATALHQSFRERLRRLDLRRAGRRTEDGETLGAKPVDDSRRQW